MGAICILLLGLCVFVHENKGNTPPECMCKGMRVCGCVRNPSNIVLGNNSPFLLSSLPGSFQSSVCPINYSITTVELFHFSLSTVSGSKRNPKWIQQIRRIRSKFLGWIYLSGRDGWWGWIHPRDTFYSMTEMSELDRGSKITWPGTRHEFACGFEMRLTYYLFAFFKATVVEY